VSVQIEKSDGADPHAGSHVSCEAETTSTPLDANNFKFALHLQQDGQQPVNSELVQQLTLHTMKLLDF